MVELMMVVEPQLPMAAERLDALAQGLAEDLRVLPKVRIAPAMGSATGHGKSPEAWELGMLVVGGLFSATTMRALVEITIAYTERTKARSIRLRRGDSELVITGSSRIDDPFLVAELARILEAPSRSGQTLARSEPEQAAIAPPVPRTRPGGSRA